MILMVIKKKTIPYNDRGNALRFMVANDRPSAYRGIFISLFANQNTINTRAVLGYYREKRTQGNNSKNTLVMGLNVLNATNAVNYQPESQDKEVEQQSREIVKESKLKGRLKNVLKLRKSQRISEGKVSSKIITMFLRRFPEMKTWAKAQGIILKKSNWRRRVRQYAKVNSNVKLETEHRWVLSGGKRKKIKKKKKKTKKRKVHKKKYKSKKNKKNKIKNKSKKQKKKHKKRKTKKYRKHK